MWAWRFISFILTLIYFKFGVFVSSLRFISMFYVKVCLVAVYIACSLFLSSFFGSELCLDCTSLVKVIYLKTEFSYKLSAGSGKMYMSLTGSLLFDFKLRPTLLNICFPSSFYRFK